MQSLKTQSWATAASQELITRIASQVDTKTGADVQRWIEELAQENHRLHDIEGINLNPATNILNPRAEKLLASGMGSRASLGHPGDKYETGLGAIEQIEIITQELALKSLVQPMQNSACHLAPSQISMHSWQPPSHTTPSSLHLLQSVATSLTTRVALLVSTASTQSLHLSIKPVTQSISMRCANLLMK